MNLSFTEYYFIRNTRQDISYLIFNTVLATILSQFLYKNDKLYNFTIYLKDDFLTWKDLMKVHSRVLMPSPLLSSLTNRITLNRRKKVMEMRALSSVFWSQGRKNRRCNVQTQTVEKLCIVHLFMQPLIHAFFQSSCMSPLSKQACNRVLNTM